MTIVDAMEQIDRNSRGIVFIVDENRQIEDIVFLDGCGHGYPALRTDSQSGVPVVIMAGGKGTRLYPYTKILPKPLIPIGDTPIMERIIDRFMQFGVDTFHITVNYKKGMIKSYFSELAPAYRIIYVEGISRSARAGASG